MFNTPTGEPPSPWHFCAKSDRTHGVRWSRSSPDPGWDGAGLASWCVDWVEQQLALFSLIGLESPFWQQVLTAPSWERTGAGASVSAMFTALFGGVTPCCQAHATFSRMVMQLHAPDQHWAAVRQPHG